MKLELKHLSPYLPYKLQVEVDIYGQKKQTGIMFGVSENEIELSGIRKTITESFNYENCKLKLKPLSKLSNEDLIPIGLLIRDIEKHKATYKDNIFAVEDAKAWIRTGMKPVLSLLQVQGIIEHLYSVHADIFNLIDAGLATELS